jgi:hypothetical protein
MPQALALMVLCPVFDDYQFVSNCKKCDQYYGTMNNEFLNCAIIEDEE